MLSRMVERLNFYKTEVIEYLDAALAEASEDETANLILDCLLSWLERQLSLRCVGYASAW